MFEIISAADFGSDAKHRISEIFIDGFGHHLKYFSNEREKLVRAFEHMFDVNQFWFACENGCPAAIAALSDNTVHTVGLDARELRKHLGFVRGTAASAVLTGEFGKQPVVSGPRIASIEFVATAQNYRRRGAAAALISAFQSSPDFDLFILEVGDTNTAAVKLYEKMGFSVFLSKKMKNQKKSGINELLYMRYAKPGTRDE